MKQSQRKRRVAAPNQGKKPSGSDAGRHQIATHVKRVTLGGVKQLTAYTFTPSCTVRDCAALKVALLDLLRVDGDVTLDVGAIERIDTAALQLLVAFVRDRKANSRNVLWAGSTASFYEAVNITGLGFALDLPITRHVGATA